MSNYTFLYALTTLAGQILRLVEVSRSHSFRHVTFTRFPVWTSDRTVAETSTWQHTTLTRKRCPCPQWDSKPQS